MATDRLHISPRQLRDLLRAITVPSEEREVPWRPHLEDLRCTLALDAVHLTLFDQEGRETRTCTVPPEEAPLPHPGDLRIPCRHGPRVVGTLEARATAGRKPSAGQRQALELVAERIALEVQHQELEQAATASAQQATAAANLIRDLREELDLRENILAGTPNGMIAVDDRRRVLLMNNAARRFFAGPGETGPQRGHPIGQYLPQQPFLECLQRVLNGASELETLDLSQAGEAQRHDYLINIFRLRRGDSWAATVIVRDMTEQRKLDDHVLRMGRVASIGQLAAGIAHEIRNPLTGIGITLDILREDPALSAEGEEMITDISREIDRLEALIRGLLDFARPQPAQRRPMRLAKALEWHRTFREQCRKKGLTCSLELETNPKIQGDPERLKQLFLNLAINALDATDSGGTVTLRTETEEVPGKPARVRVEVSDTGRGMDEQTLQQVFDPFFTTKNEGTGLGLSIAHSIAEQHGGRIDVTSTPGAGTTFRVELPAYEPEEEIGSS